MKNIRYVTDKTAVLIFTPENRRYLTGFASSLGYLLLTKEGNFLFVDGRYYEDACRKASGTKVVLIDKIFEQINSLLSRVNAEKLLIETENEISFFNILKKNLKVKVHPHEKLSTRLSVMRSVKSKEEISSIIQAQEIAERAFLDLLNIIKVGVTEREIAAYLEYKMKIYGSEGAAFDTIAVSGSNSSLPHGVPTDKPIANGDFITMDFGAKINGYCSDMTRTVAVGSVTDEMRLIYETVLAAQNQAILACAAGVDCSSVDAAARSYIDQAGFGNYFTHSTGHSLGLFVHESPNISRASKGIKLRKGQVITAEPGIYLPGKFGVRIEDMLLITKSGCKNLTKAPKDLIIL